MRLQRDQLCDNLGRGRETLLEREKAFTERPDSVTLLRYLSMLDQRQEFEKLLSVFETDGPARKIAFPTSEENLPIWCQLVHAAAETGDTGFIEQYLPPVLAVCGPALEMELSGLTSGSFKTFLCSPFKCAREYAIIKIYCDF